ncbi:P-loop containing nucleoside triphosphate hydrolase protein [Dioscorea alata]|uniref:P-loop containing nucleoside triphosphate hydrolase protein n=5 Tax=Dioscorea alata TaxID=55571 RepID=A0ACB7VAA7_DIOAL|nr:P-loop containing nucleoside triphosphate hydrolase protein [Dioscorea alata]KAH7670712.1 P-loop containing nucleoside triphosphate hydrolase protein [Dioscorea alata]KAH7670713.1 P-loop containing nucleoside triphosphate hydrolase protein [Dioscorea alata]KAH7670714.1 P-loop containing nucleoside triphosphate hydrolase protein [Dioscorea alata]KAH7670715.1 P-loop containing nucleoside triphosphate hydrolase protein [Dioscorea alata]
MPPSKGKKPSRSLPSARSPSSASRSPSTPARDSKTEVSGDDEQLVSLILSCAAAKFPNLISDSAFCARVSETETSLSKGGNYARIWLSEATMVSSSLSPGSFVSVSLATSDKTFLKDAPLETLAEECARHFGVETGDKTSDGAGNFFAIATVFPSRKVLKNGAKLSWGLSCTMGFPSVGRAIFVFPISSFSTSHNQNMNNSIAQFPICKCNDLYLNLVLPKSAVINFGYDKSPLGTSTDKLTSPKTPASRPKLSSPGATPVQSKKSSDYVSNIDSSACQEISGIRLALADEKVNELLQIYAGRWLHGRSLLNGNFVTVPICGHLCLFLVEGVSGSRTDCSNPEHMSERKCNLPPLEIDNRNSMNYADTIFLVDAKTKVHLSDPVAAVKNNPTTTGPSAVEITCRSIGEKQAGDIPRLGGLSKEITALNEIIMFSLGNNYSLPRYKGVLLYGPPGTGKTSLATYCVHGVGASLFSINGPEIISQYYGESEQALHDVFESARRAAPSVVFIDELDAIAPARKDGGEGLSVRMVATLLKLLDEIDNGERILLIAATNRPDSIDPALRRPGRFDREIEIGVPSPDQRLDILQTLLSDIDHSLSSKEIQTLAMATHGFVAADLAALCNEAAMTALRRYIKFGNSDKHAGALSSLLAELSVSVKPVSCLGSEKALETQDMSQTVEEPDLLVEMMLKVSIDDFEKAKMKVRPSAMREVMLEFPKVSWEDVGGQAEVKKQLIEAIQWPQLCPDAFRRIGIRPPRGLLMIGPPGCSKTLMARAAASEAKLNFLAVKGPELFSKWVGESEKAVKSLFAKARANAPAIIFFDEIDGLAITRGQDGDGTSVADRVLSQLLVEMDGLDQRVAVTVIAATNRPDKIDHALLRPGRFDRLLDVQPPNEADRKDIFCIHMRSIPCSADACKEELARLTEGYTGADIKLICREAAVAALEESLEAVEVSMAHFKIGIGRVQPSNIQFYQELATQFRRLVDSRAMRDE